MNQIVLRTNDGVERSRWTGNIYTQTMKETFRSTLIGNSSAFALFGLILVVFNLCLAESWPAIIGRNSLTCHKNILSSYFVVCLHIKLVTVHNIWKQPRAKCNITISFNTDFLFLQKCCMTILGSVLLTREAL